MGTISVVIPIRNGAEFLTRCLASLKASTTSALEYLVVDDGSSDHSCQIAQDWGATVFRMQGKTGPAAARNLAASHAKGEVLLFLDADVRIHTDGPKIRVLRLVDAMKTQSWSVPVKLQIKRSSLRCLLLLGIEPGERSGKGLGDAEFH